MFEFKKLSMFIVSGISSDTVTLRGQLKHAWLENQLLNKTEDDIVFLWQGPGWPALKREFPVRLLEAERLIGDIEDGFSPAQLVDKLLPLAGLDESSKLLLKKTVHAVYLEGSGIPALKGPIKEAVFELSGALARFLVAWDQSVSKQAELEVRHLWRNLLRCGEKLRDTLDLLPRGIVLP